MTADQRTLDAVLRFPHVALSRESFEATLQASVDRFEPLRIGPAHYAQINLLEGATWHDLIELLDPIGARIAPYLLSGEIVRPRVDAALYVFDDKASASLLIPGAAAFAIGSSGFDLEVSAYLTATD